MATAGKVEAVEVYTVNEPCGAKTIEYKVSVMIHDSDVRYQMSDVLVKICQISDVMVMTIQMPSM